MEKQQKSHSSRKASSVAKAMDDKSKGTAGLWQALALAGQLGYTIAIPLVILALLGRFLDSKYNTSPWFLLAGILLSLAVTSVWITKKSMSIMAEMNEELKKQSENFEKMAKNNEKIIDPESNNLTPKT